MKTKSILILATLHINLLLLACNPSPPPGNQTLPSASPSSSPSQSVEASATPDPIPTQTPASNLPATTPAPSSNPAAGTSTSVNLPDGSKLLIILGNRFLDSVGQTLQLQVSLTDANGQPLPLDSLKLSYSSSRPQDIAITPQGLITALVDQGFSEISVRIDGTEIQSSQLISVNSLESYSGGGGAGPKKSEPPTQTQQVTAEVEFEGLDPFAQPEEEPIAP